MTILGQVWYDNRMGISLGSLGISLGFRNSCERYLLMGISPKSLGISLCFRRPLGRVRPPRESYKSPLEFACLPHSQSLLHVFLLLLSYCSCLPRPWS